jgi:hypothetical protein
MDFVGLKDERKSQSPSLTSHNATNDDVSLASFGLPLVKGATLRNPTRIYSPVFIASQTKRSRI